MSPQLPVKSAGIPTFEEWKNSNAEQPRQRDESPAPRGTTHSLSPSRSSNTRSVSPSGRTFQSRRPAPRPPGRNTPQEDQKSVTQEMNLGNKNDLVVSEMEYKKDENGLNVDEGIGTDEVDTENSARDESNDSKTEEFEKHSDKIIYDNIDAQLKSSNDMNKVDVTENDKSSCHEGDDVIDVNKIKIMNGSEGESNTVNIKNNELKETIEKIEESKAEDMDAKYTIEKTEESKAEEVDTKENKNAEIKALARQVLMEARKKAGASDSLPRDRVGISPTQSTTDLTTESSDKESLKGDSENVIRSASFGQKPAKPPKPSSIREKMKVK